MSLAPYSNFPLLTHCIAPAPLLQEKGRLALAVKNEAARRQKAEGELRRSGEQLAFRVGEVKHLKEALKGRDGTIQDLQDRLRAFELADGEERTAAETVRQAEGGCWASAGECRSGEREECC